MIDDRIIAALEFTSPAMLGWLAAAALPWLINLWSRRRHVETPWAAVDLLLAAVRERSRRLRLREWLLLALRTAILLLVALAAARPVWQASAGTATSQVRTHLVIVIDQSASMATIADETSRFERAKLRARRLVQEAPAGDAVSVIGWATGADNLLGSATFEPDRALAAIDSLSSVDTIADLSEGLRAAEKALDEARQEFPQLAASRVVLISDLAMNTWTPLLSRPIGAPQRDAHPAGARAQWEKLARRATIQIESVDEGVRDNLALAAVRLDPPAPRVGEPFVAAVELAPYGSRSWQDAPVELRLDEARIGRQRINVNPGRKAIASFDARLVEPGNHLLEARLAEGVDALAVDDRRWLSFEVRPRPRVICFADIASSAEDVARALNPRFRDAGAPPAGGIEVETAATSNLASTDLASFDAVFLCNVSQLSSREARLLRRYVAAGGATALVLGNRVQPAAYDELLAATPDDPATPLLPVRLEDRFVEGSWRIDPLEYRHPIMTPFAGRSRAGLLGVRVSRYWPLRIDAGGSIAAAFDSGDAAIVTGDYGLGRAAVMATDPTLLSGGEPWSSFGVSPSFVPLMRELFRYLTDTGRDQQLNRLAGEPLASTEKLIGRDGGGQWQSPDGQITSVPPDTRHRGVYTFQPSSAARGIELDDGQSVSIAVNVDVRESDLATVDAADLPSRAGAESNLPAGISTISRNSLPLERYLLTAAAALVLAELAVAWLLGRGWA